MDRLLERFVECRAFPGGVGGALVLGDGLLPTWNDVTVRGLRTEYGSLDFTVRPVGKGVRYRISGPDVPPGGIMARWRDTEVVIRELPADVVVERDFAIVDRVLRP